MRPEGPDGPFAQQLEWLDHRYDPGYFLGGTLRPELRLSLGSRAKRYAGLLAFSAGLAVLLFGLLNSGAHGVFLPDPGSLTLGVLNLSVGRRMWRAADADGSDRAADVAELARRLYRVAGMVAVGTAIVAAGGLAVLSLVAAVTMGLTGRPGIAAGIAVLLAMAVLHKRRAGSEPT